MRAFSANKTTKNFILVTIEAKKYALGLSNNSKLKRVQIKTQSNFFWGTVLANQWRILNGLNKRACIHQTVKLAEKQSRLNLFSDLRKEIIDAHHKLCFHLKTFANNLCPSFFRDNHFSCYNYRQGCASQYIHC